MTREIYFVPLSDSKRLESLLGVPGAHDLSSEQSKLGFCFFFFTYGTDGSTLLCCSPVSLRSVVFNFLKDGTLKPESFEYLLYSSTTAPASGRSPEKLVSLDLENLTQRWVFQHVMGAASDFEDLRSSTNLEQFVAKAFQLFFRRFWGTSERLGSQKLMFTFDADFYAEWIKLLFNLVYSENPPNYASLISTSPNQFLDFLIKSLIFELMQLQTVPEILLCLENDKYLHKCITLAREVALNHVDIKNCCFRL